MNHAEVVAVPVRDGVVPPQQYPVQRPSRRHQFGAARCMDQAVDQRIDDRIFDASDVAAARLVRDGAGPVVALLIAGTMALASD